MPTCNLLFSWITTSCWWRFILYPGIMINILVVKLDSARENLHCKKITVEALCHWHIQVKSILLGGVCRSFMRGPNSKAWSMISVLPNAWLILAVLNSFFITWSTKHIWISIVIYLWSAEKLKIYEHCFQDKIYTYCTSACLIAVKNAVDFPQPKFKSFTAKKNSYLYQGPFSWEFINW